MALTPKQERFVQEYIVDRNATQAAIRAGYSEKTAGVIGSENLDKPNIAGEIAKRTKVIAEKVEITQERVVEALASMGFHDVALDTLRPADKLKALELLGRYLGMFTERSSAPDKETETPKLIAALRGDDE